MGSFSINVDVISTSVGIGFVLEFSINYPGHYFKVLLFPFRTAVLQNTFSYKALYVRRGISKYLNLLRGSWKTGLVTIDKV